MTTSLLSTTYIGRFAPSPSGPLHLGSLVAALGSYLQAKSQHGRWLVRMEDIDPPREQAGAASYILKQLDQFGLHWDGDVLYQSQRSEAYQAQLSHWLEQDLAYYCQCTRKQIKQSGTYYSGHCRNLNLPAANSALRLRTATAVSQFQDKLCGHIHIPCELAKEDFIVQRRDGLFAYNLAATLDDIEQGITEVVRGADLLLPTGRQIYIYQSLGLTPPRYLHLPLLLDAQGNKLSKQNHAPAIEEHAAQSLLLRALSHLNQSVNPHWLRLSCEALLAEALKTWDVSKCQASKL